MQSVAHPATRERPLGDRVAMGDPLQLAELVAAKLSHDLSGLLGSLTGVLEVAGEASGGATDEIALAAETASILLLRLQLLREAWGGVAKPMDLPTLAARKRGTIGEQRLKLDRGGCRKEPCSTCRWRGWS
jgi:hypothetical protein